MKLLGSIFTILTVFATASWAGQPVEWQLSFQQSASPVMDQLVDLHDLLLIVIFCISIFVLILLTYTCVRFRAKNNPKPSKTSHNTLLEVIWTGVPVLILLALVVPMMKVLYFAEEQPKSDMTLKVVGYQWYWGYEYSDYDGLSFESRMIPDKDIDESAGEVRLLSTDNELVLPVDTNIRVQITAADVIHAWAIPAFGVKKDAVPGRLNETWMRIDKVGTYYGQCSELCGVGHGFMPIEIKAVSKEDFAKWVESAKQKYAKDSSKEYSLLKDQLN